MNAVEKIKAAAAGLGPDERVELFRWWVESPEFKQGQLAALKREIARAIDDLENGRSQTYDATNAMQLAEEVGLDTHQRLKPRAQKSRVIFKLHQMFTKPKSSANIVIC